jgi:myo-inositol 2-dehydrogenase/D-chiro-inositol 1-dehydrogenase
MNETDLLFASSRRTFLKTAAASAAAFAIATPTRAQSADVIRVGVIGCGKRGTGAINDCIQSSENVRIVALGDVLPDKLAACRKELTKLGDAVQVTDDTCFTGFDAYEGVIGAGVDLVLLTAPPAFRPLHLKAAVEAGKHVFMEKPVAVDPVGIRSVLASSEAAKQKGLCIVAGTQRRHQKIYLATMKRVHDGAIGDLVSAECYWVGDYGYYMPPAREASWSDMEWQLRNWNYFTWLSGDHIVEQHVHNIDVIQWALGANPVTALGMGGRQQRTGEEFGHIWDHFAVEFQYPNDVRVTSLCRQNKGTASKVSEYLVGTKGVCIPQEGVIRGEAPYTFEEEKNNPYVQEHADLIAAIRKGEALNEGEQVALSTMAAIVGRLSAYSGQEVAWDWAMNESRLDLSPARYELGPLPVAPVAVPGEYELI